MSAPIIQLADAVTDLLNTSGAFTPALGATRAFQPYYELPAAQTAKVIVIGTGDRSLERADRSGWKHELTVEVLLQQKLADDDNATRDALVLTADDICEYLKQNWPESSDFDLMLASVQSLLQPEVFRIARLFTTTVRLTFWHHR